MKTSFSRIIHSLTYIAVGFCLWLATLMNFASAAVLYWDNNGTSTPSGGTWDATTKNWASSSTLTTSTVVWNTADAAVFCAGSTSAGTITVNVNTANLACGGFFNNGVAGSSCTLTLAGTGSLSLNSGLQGIYVSSGVSSTINIPINGAGGLEPEGSGYLNLYAANGYTGGTTLANGSTFTQFNNNNAFGTGAITINGGPGIYAPLLSVGGTLITLPNAFVAGPPGGGVNFASAASTPVTCTGNWDLQANLGLKNNGDYTAPLTLSGVISDYASLTTGGDNGGTIILSGANTYSGPTTNISGMLMLANPSALGSSATTVAAGNTAELDLNGNAISTAITLNGTGTNGIGALINSNINSTASIQGSVVAAALVTAAGSGITAPATFTVSGGGGSGAAVTPGLGVTAATFTINAGSQKYTAVPTITISGGGGVGATATASLAGTSPALISTTITITAPGYGFTSAPTIAFSGGTKSGSGTAPTGTGNATHFQLTGARVTAGGSGYTSAPTLTLSSGTGTAVTRLSGVNLATSSSIGGPGNTTINGIVSGTGSSGLTKVGTGALTLPAVNTYSGPTTVTGGKLVGVVGGSCASSAVEVQTGGNTLGISITNNTQQWTCAGLTIDDNTAALDFNFSSLVAPSATVAPLNVNGPVTFTGTPAVTVEAGSLPPGPGTYPLMTWTSVSGTPPTSVTLQGRAIGNLSVAGNTLYLNITANADPIDWTVSGTGTWDINTSQNWNDSTGAATYYLQPATPGDAVVFDDTYITAAPTVTLNSTVSPAAVTVNDSAYNYTISGAGGITGSCGLSKQGSATLLLTCTNTYTGGTTISGGTLQLGDGVANNGVVAGNILNNASLVFSNFYPQTESGAINGAGSLAVSGPSALILSGVNTFSGPTTINSSSALTIGGAGQLGGGGYAANIANNGIFTNNSTAAQTYSGVVSGTGALVQNGTGTLTLSGVNTYNGPTTISAGTLAIGGAGQLGSGTYSMAITDNGTLNDASSASQTLSGVISGTGALVNSGSGTLTLSGANTYTGNTTVSAGIVTVSAIADSGTSGINASTNTLTLSGGEFQYTGSAAVTSGRAVTVTGTASIIDLPNGDLTFTNQVKNGAACVLNKTGSGTLTLGGTNDNAFLGLTVNGGTVILNKTLIGHAVGGTTTVNNGGTLQLAGNGYGTEIYAGVNVTVNSGGVLDANGQNDIFTSLTIAGNGAGSGALINSAASTTSAFTNTAAAGVVLTGNTALGGSGNLFLQGVITGNYSLTNIGTGVVTLNSNNTYSGSTVISSGTIALAKNGSIAASPAIIIGSGAVFDVSGLASALALGAGQQIQVAANGTSAASTINMSSGLNLSAGGLVFTSYGGGSTAPLTAASAGSLNLNGAPVIVTTTTPLGNGTYTLISASGSAAVTGSSGALTLGGSGLAGDCTASLSVSGGALQLIVVTNPPTITNAIVTENVTAGSIWKIAITNLASVAGWGDSLGHSITLSSVGPMSTNGIGVTKDADYIYYGTNVTIADQFTYTITDGILTANGTVNLVPVSVPSPNIVSPTVNGSGNPAFGGNGIPGYVYGVESATSLSGPWVEAGNVTAGSDGSWNFTDPTQTNPPTIFYRVYYPDNPSNPPQ